jgi:hypothetical protein
MAADDLQACRCALHADDDEDDTLATDKIKKK